MFRRSLHDLLKHAQKQGFTHEKSVLKTAEAQVSEGSNPSLSAIFVPKNGERSRKASLHAASAALHSKGGAFSSHLHFPGSLACEGAPFTVLVPRGISRTALRSPSVACEDVRFRSLVKFAPCGSKDGAAFYGAAPPLCGERSRKASLPCHAIARRAKAERGDSRSSLKSRRLFFLVTP